MVNRGLGKYGLCKKERIMADSSPKKMKMERKMVLMGDFNDLTSNEEKWGGIIRCKGSFGNFIEFIRDNQLVDIGIEGKL